MKKKNIKKIHEVLLNLKKGKIKYPQHGICLNLQLSLMFTDSISDFLDESFIKIYGENYLPYPIEGNWLAHYSDNNKWNPDTLYGKKRLELLQKLIDYAEEIINAE